MVHFNNENDINVKPLVSIITVVYNGVKTLEKTIQSVLNQTFQNIEYIIVDGNSKDGTIDIIRKYEKQISYWISEPDNGIYDAMNKGIKLAHGQYIVMLNSGDTYDSIAIEKAAEEMKKNKFSVDVYYGMMRIMSENNKILWIYGYTHNFLSSTMIAHPTCLVKKQVYEQFQYDENYKSAADYDFFLRLNKNGFSFNFLEIIFGNYLLGGMSDSYLGYKETLKIKYKYGLISWKSFFFHKILGYLKWCLNGK